MKRAMRERETPIAVITWTLLLTGYMSDRSRFSRWDASCMARCEKRYCPITKRSPLMTRYPSRSRPTPINQCGLHNCSGARRRCIFEISCAVAPSQLALRCPTDAKLNEISIVFSGSDISNSASGACFENGF